MNAACLRGIALPLLVTIATCLANGCASSTFPRGAVAADQPLASQAGAQMLREGGNAVDAAVAASFCLSVVRPYSCGIGGGGFMVVHLEEHPVQGPLDVAINYREMAPASVGPTYFETLDMPDASTRSGHAVGVPGTVAGLLHALDRFGTMSREDVLRPAIEAAEAGFVVDSHYLANARARIKWFEADPTRIDRFTFVWKRFLKSGDLSLGDRIRLPEQAEALRRIAQHGRAGFYEGSVAEAIVRAVADAGGTLAMDDLSGYQVKQVAPLAGAYRDYTLLTMPPPSSGGLAMIQTLGILERIDDVRLRNLPQDAYIHRVTEASKHAFADRARYLGDPDFVPVPLDKLTDPAYLESRAAVFDPDRTLPPASYGLGTNPPDDAGTSHLCAVDQWGNAVACTETINLVFGSHVAVPEFGFVLNDEMDDFLTRRGVANAFQLTQSEWNLPAPGKRPLSSMSPTIVLDSSGKVAVVAGASGGPRIITGTLQAILNVIEYDANAIDAVGKPRFHHQWMPDTLFFEDGWLWRPDVVDGMITRGHDVRGRSEIANVQLIRSVPDGWQAGSDPRKGGRPDGH